MTAPSEIDAAPREDELSPHISNALKRIKSGWRVEYTCYGLWRVWRHAHLQGGLFRHSEWARAEYLRLSAREE
jgi:hypothetical protein